MGPTKIIMGGNDRAPANCKKRAKCAFVGLRKPIFRSSFHFELIHYTQNKEHKKATYTRNSFEMHWCTKKVEAQLATPMMYDVI